MFEYPKYKNQKAIDAILFLLHQAPHKKMQKVKLMKMLYFAEGFHLLKYGELISTGTIVKFPKGPVPEQLYQFIEQPNEYIKKVGVEYASLKCDDYFFGELTESEEECLNQSYELNKDKDTWDLSNESHKLAWNNASRGGKLNIQDILIEFGDENLTKLEDYRYHLENEALFN